MNHEQWNQKGYTKREVDLKIGFDKSKDLPFFLLLVFFEIQEISDYTPLNSTLSKDKPKFTLEPNQKKIMILWREFFDPDIVRKILDIHYAIILILFLNSKTYETHGVVLKSIIIGFAKP